MNPFDEWPKYFWGDERLMKQITDRYGHIHTHTGQLIIDMLAWRKKWEPVILKAMDKADTLDLFYELGESARAMVEESVAEYMREREG